MSKLSKEAMREIATLSQIDISEKKLSILAPKVNQILETLQPLVESELGEIEPQLIFCLHQE